MIFYPAMFLYHVAGIVVYWISSIETMFGKNLNNPNGSEVMSFFVFIALIPFVLPAILICYFYLFFSSVKENHEWNKSQRLKETGEDSLPKKEKTCSF
jgi:flagellar basal body-associated protein FliL